MQIICQVNYMLSESNFYVKLKRSSVTGTSKCHTHRNRVNGNDLAMYGSGCDHYAVRYVWRESAAEECYAYMNTWYLYSTIIQLAITNTS